MTAEKMLNTVPIQKLVEHLGAGAVFGTPVENNGGVVLPVAQVHFGFGYGGGYSPSQSNDEAASSSERESSEDSGGGGGAGGRIVPRGYIRMTGDEVKYEPIVDPVRIPLFGILMAAWTIFWVMLTVRVIAKAVAKTRQQALKVKNKREKNKSAKIKNGEAQ